MRCYLHESQYYARIFRKKIELLQLWLPFAGAINWKTVLVKFVSDQKRNTFRHLNKTIT